MSRSRHLGLVVLVVVSFVTSPAWAQGFRFQAAGGLGVGLSDVGDESHSGFGGELRVTLGADFARQFGAGAYYSHARSAIDPIEDSGTTLDRSVRESGFGLYGAFDAGLVRFDAYAGYAFGSLTYSVPDTGLSTASLNVGLDGLQVGALVGYDVEFTRTISMQFGPWFQLGFMSTEGEISSELVGVEPDESITHIMLLFAVQLSVGT